MQIVAPIIPVSTLPALTDIKQKCRNIATVAEFARNTVLRLDKAYRDIFSG